MALNPFEQLAFFAPEPDRRFIEIVEAILRDRFGSTPVRRCSDDGRTYVTDWPSGPGSGPRVTLYQAEYFVGKWRSSQRRRMHDALQRALQEARAPDRWVLCVPTRAIPKDLDWFENWRKRCPVEVELLDGNELLHMLRGPDASTARKKLHAWGVTVPNPEVPQVGGRLRISAADPVSGLTYYLYATVHNDGGRAANDLRVELAHSLTNCLSLRHDERHWKDEGDGLLNPRRLRACRLLGPREELLVAVIPISAETSLPVNLRVRLWSAETAKVDQHLCLDQTSLKPEGRYHFIAGPDPATTGLGPMLAPPEDPNGSAAAA